ncbi:unnamed protein product [Arabis nemorensis]|uniref:Uncharacterized protein n=1 Tax=Arabis nemorensis TaxID=586526 RepID=A0A565C7D5_9BRAS|nr:unnamed protein product [Arabis nemorensis]
MHIIHRTPSTKLPEGPYSATSAVRDPSHLPMGERDRNFPEVFLMEKSSKFSSSTQMEMD